MDYDTFVALYRSLLQCPNTVQDQQELNNFAEQHSRRFLSHAIQALSEQDISSPIIVTLKKDIQKPLQSSAFMKVNSYLREEILTAVLQKLAEQDNFQTAKLYADCAAQMGARIIARNEDSTVLTDFIEQALQSGSDLAQQTTGEVIAELAGCQQFSIDEKGSNPFILAIQKLVSIPSVSIYGFRAMCRLMNNCIHFGGSGLSDECTEEFIGAIFKTIEGVQDFSKISPILKELCEVIDTNQELVQEHAETFIDLAICAMQSPLEETYTFGVHIMSGVLCSDADVGDEKVKTAITLALRLLVVDEKLVSSFEAAEEPDEFFDQNSREALVLNALMDVFANMKGIAAWIEQHWVGKENQSEQDMYVALWVLQAVVSNFATTPYDSCKAMVYLNGIIGDIESHSHLIQYLVFKNMADILQQQKMIKFSVFHEVISDVQKQFVSLISKLAPQGLFKFLQFLDDLLQCAQYAIASNMEEVLVKIPEQLANPSLMVQGGVLRLMATCLSKNNEHTKLSYMQHILTLIQQFYQSAQQVSQNMSHQNQEFFACFTDFVCQCIVTYKDHQEVQQHVPGVVGTVANLIKIEQIDLLPNVLDSLIRFVMRVAPMFPAAFYEHADALTTKFLVILRLPEKQHSGLDLEESAFDVHQRPTNTLICMAFQQLFTCIPEHMTRYLQDLRAFVKQYQQSIMLSSEGIASIITSITFCSNESNIDELLQDISKFYEQISQPGYAVILSEIVAPLETMVNALCARGFLNVDRINVLMSCVNQIIQAKNRQFRNIIKMHSDPGPSELMCSLGVERDEVCKVGECIQKFTQHLIACIPKAMQEQIAHAIIEFAGQIEQAPLNIYLINAIILQLKQQQLYAQVLPSILTKMGAVPLFKGELQFVLDSILSNTKVVKLEHIPLLEKQAQLLQKEGGLNAPLCHMCQTLILIRIYDGDDSEKQQMLLNALCGLIVLGGQQPDKKRAFGVELLKKFLTSELDPESMDDHCILEQLYWQGMTHVSGPGLSKADRRYAIHATREMGERLNESGEDFDDMAEGLDYEAFVLMTDIVNEFASEQVAKLRRRRQEQWEEPEMQGEDDDEDDNGMDQVD